MLVQVTRLRLSQSGNLANLKHAYVHSMSVSNRLSPLNAKPIQPTRDDERLSYSSPASLLLFVCVGHVVRTHK